jgi:DNA-directed RNA polymerase specialized sigma24 family protein
VGLEEALAAYHARVFRTAWRVTGSAADAEDVLQTVFLRHLRRAAPGFDRQPGNYLSRAAVTAALAAVPLDDGKCPATRWEA